jgi:hypothetical protein
MKVALNTINHHLLPLMAYDYLFGIFIQCNGQMNKNNTTKHDFENTAQKTKD